MNNKKPSLGLHLFLPALLLICAIGPGCAQSGATSDVAHPSSAQGAAPATAPAVVATSQPMDPVIARIRDEGLNHSEVMKTLSYLCDVIGPRLTASPQGQYASEWTYDQFIMWGLANVHLESWGPFGRGWSVKRFAIQVDSPQTIILKGYPKAWSPGFSHRVTAPVVWLDGQQEADLDAYRGTLEGKIVLIGASRPVDARFEPLASRLNDSELERLASAAAGSSAMLGQPRTITASERRAQLAASGAAGEALVNRATSPTSDSTTEPTTGPTSRPSSRRGRRAANPFAARAFSFAADEGAALIITPSTQGDGGTFFVQGASVPETPAQRTSSTTQAATAASTTASTASSTAPAAAPAAEAERPTAWSKDAPSIPPQITLAIEDYNRLIRMIGLGETLEISCDLEVTFHDEDLMAYNTIAEIPGSDLKDEVVMVGGHLDSWHSGTGATDNGVGAAAAMEAVRIIRALNLKPRRTIRVALWTGEEQGILGSTAYVKRHFGYDDTPRPQPGSRPTSNPVDANADRASETAPASRPARRIVKAADYEKLAVYFNLDNGTGKIRGIYAQGNEEAAVLFRQWLQPFADLGANVVTISNTGSTDHIPFDRIGLPGFQFIQDPVEYGSRTHHSNEDVYDRIQADDMKQASTILATFVWEAANMDTRFPRKSEPPNER